MLYAITDRRLYAESETDARTRLLELAALWAANGVAYIQLREKDLSARAQLDLARAIMRTMRPAAEAHGSAAPRLLVNSRVDVALAAGADGVHLPSGPGELTPEEARGIFSAVGRRDAPVVSVSCHSPEEVKIARERSADCILFAPVFEKATRRKEIASDATEIRESERTLPGAGLAMLGEACRVAAPVPVFALGGVTAENAADCIRAGATGVAAIRLLTQPASTWRELA